MTTICPRNPPTGTPSPTGMSSGVARHPIHRASATGDIITMPVARGDGRYIAPAIVVQALDDNGQVVRRYVGDNPNGAVVEIAGIANVERNVVVMMPHPERIANSSLGSALGMTVFASPLQGAPMLQGGSA